MICRFEGFELHEERRELRRGGQQLGLPRKSFELLRYLLHHAGRVVSKEEIFASLWPGEHVSEAVLPVNMRTIRKALGESVDGAVIRTVRGCGYAVACRVEWLEGARAASPLSSGLAEVPIVGRAALLAELEVQLGCAEQGQGCAILLYGDAGVGKTRVLEEFAQRARERGALVLHVRCEQSAGAPPFWTLTELLRAAQVELERGPLRDMAAAVGFDAQAAHARMLSLFGAEPTRGMDPDVARFRMARSTVQHAEALAQLAPLVLVLDDLHSMDEGSLRVCAALIRQIDRRRVLLLGSYRDDLQPGEPLAQALGGLATERALRQFPLHGLDAQAVRELFSAEAGFEPEPLALRSLYECTEGNPFFLRELLRLLAAEGRLRPGGCSDLSRVGLPRASREVIERRLQLVSRNCNEVLVWAAVIGRRFAFPLLEQVSGRCGTPLLELLREAAEARVLDCGAHSGSAGAPALGEYGFAHALVREAIYTRLSGPERVLRHRAVGEALERLRCGSHAERGVELAHHFFEAAPGGDIDRAVQYCVAAGRQALLLFAYEDAVRQFAHALRAEELRAPAAPLRICCAALALGDALRRAGRYEEARDTFQRAAQTAQELGRADLLAYSALGLAKWPRFVGPKLPFKIVPCSTREQRDEVMALVEMALRALSRAGDVNERHLPLRARLVAVRARFETRGGRRAAGSAQSDRALELARGSCDRRAIFDALLAKRVSLCTPQDAKQALEISSELVEVAGALGAEPLLFAACEARIPALLALGELPAADADIDVLCQIAARLRTPVYEYNAVRLRVGRLLGDGQIETARPLLLRLKSLGHSAGDANVRWSFNSIGVWMLYLEGRSELVRSRIEAVFEGGSVQNAGAHVFAADYWRGIGEKQRSAEHFEIAAAKDFADIDIDSDWLWTLCNAVQVCTYLGDKRRAQRLYSMISPHAQLNVTNLMAGYRGSAQLPLGCLAQLLDKPSQAAQHFEAALAFNQRIGARTARLFAQTHLGRALLRSGSREGQQRGQEMLLGVEREAAALGLGRLRHASQPRAEI